MVSHYVSFTYLLPGNKGSVSRTYRVIRSSSDPISEVNENCRYISDVHSSNSLSSSERFPVLTLSVEDITSLCQKGFPLSSGSVLVLTLSSYENEYIR